MTDFKPGDRVVGETGTEFDVAHGPYTGLYGARMYLVTNANGHSMQVLASSLSAAPTDPRREAVRWALLTGTVLTGDECDAAADAVLAALDAHESGSESTKRCDRKVPDCAWCAELPATEGPARYRDRNEDVWEVQPDGRPLLVEFANGDTDETPNDYCASVGVLEDRYGPITRV